MRLAMSPSSLKSVAVAFLAVLVIGAFLYFVGGAKWTGTADAAVTPATTGGEATYPESAFADGKARFFEYKS